MADDPIEEVEPEEVEETDDGETNWARMESLINGAVKKNLADLNLEGTIEKVVKKWRAPAPKNSPVSQKPEETKETGSSTNSRKKGLLSNGFFKGL